MDVDLNVLYTFAGDRDQDDTVEISLATEWHVTHYVGLIAELANARRMGSVRGPEAGELNEMEATVGLSWQVSKYLKFELGIVFKEHGIWEAVFAWEWNFGGD